MLALKKKFLTFSYDDGVTQDIRLIEILNRYGLKGTFNLNSGLFGLNDMRIREDSVISHCRLKKEDILSVYEGHEIAVHTLTHRDLASLSDKEVVWEVERDRMTLSDLVGYEVTGMAYPYGYHEGNDHTAELIKYQTGIQYARTTKQTLSFDPPHDLHQMEQTIFHCDWDNLFRLGEKFLSMKPTYPQIFSVWGHSYELDIRDNWDRFEQFCQMMAGKEDIYYGTNMDIFLATH